MQVFLMPSTLCDKLDRMARKFLWGVNEERGNFLTLWSWNNICVRKLVGGLGIRQFKEANIAYITKLGWKLCTEGNRIWVKLIRSKSLRGRRKTDFQTTSRFVSWIWQGISGCKDSLDNGICYSIGQDSKIQIQVDPWIPTILQFWLSQDVWIPEHICRVGHWWIWINVVGMNGLLRRYSLKIFTTLSRVFPSVLGNKIG